MFTYKGGRVNPIPTSVAEISLVAKGNYRLVFWRVAGNGGVTWAGTGVPGWFVLKVGTGRCIHYSGPERDRRVVSDQVVQ